MHHKMSHRLQETMRGFARSTDDSKSARSQEAYGESWAKDSNNNSPSLYRLPVLQRSFSHRNLLVRSPDQWPPGSCPRGVCGAAHQSRAACMPAWDLAWKTAWMSARVARLSFEQPT